MTTLDLIAKRTWLEESFGPIITKRADDGTYIGTIDKLMVQSPTSRTVVWAVAATEDKSIENLFSEVAGHWNKAHLVVDAGRAHMRRVTVDRETLALKPFVLVAS